jgi:hypothetical protein
LIILASPERALMIADLAGPTVTTRLTPYTTVPRGLHWFAATRARQRLANFLIFCAVPTLLFWTWYPTAGARHIPDDYDLLRVAAPLSGLFTLVGPLAFQQGEFIYERLLRSISEDGYAGGWNIAAIQQKIDQLDRIYYQVTIPLAVAAATAIGYVFNEIRDIAPLSSTSAKLGALVVLGFIGFTSATAVWGAVKVAIVVNTITRTANPTWSPFRTEPQGIHELFRFAWTEGVIFSLGNITAPALLVAMPRLSLPAKVISWGFITLTFVGGLSLFALTSLWLLAMARRQHVDALDRLAPILERLAQQVPDILSMPGSEVLRLRHGLEATLLLHEHIQNSTPSPVSRRAVLAATTTLVVPVLLTLLQVATSKL